MTTPEPDFPFAGQACRLVYISMQGERRLPFLDETLDGDAADMDIQSNVLVDLLVERRTVERRVARWSMKEENGTIERVFFARRFFKENSIPMEQPKLTGTMLPIRHTTGCPIKDNFRVLLN